SLLQNAPVMHRPALLIRFRCRLLRHSCALCAVYVCEKALEVSRQTDQPALWWVVHAQHRLHVLALATHCLSLHAGDLESPTTTTVLPAWRCHKAPSNHHW